jgi:hypothetical protein
MSEISAYEKMLEDGSAFKKIDMQRITNQMYSQAEGGHAGGDIPLGDPIKEQSTQYNSNGLEEDHTDWSAVDAAMEKRMDALREKITAKKGSRENTKASQLPSQEKEIKKLKMRVKRLEEALMIIMETQEKLLG